MFIHSLKRRLWHSYIFPATTLLLLAVPITATAEPFTVSTTPDQLITLKADNASLRLVVEQIARELKIEIQARISDNEKVTEDFSDIPLERALKLLSQNYITVTERKSGKIAKIFFLPQGQEAPRLITEVRPPATPATPNDNRQDPQDTSTAAVEPDIEEDQASPAEEEPATPDTATTEADQEQSETEDNLATDEGDDETQR